MCTTCDTAHLKLIVMLQHVWQELVSNNIIPHGSDSLLEFTNASISYYLLRVGGRLNKGSFCKDLKHPVILPRKSHVTELIISHFHQKLKHQGRSMTTNKIRQGGFWIIDCSSAVYTFISKCVICCKFRGKIQKQRMSDLPMDRIQPEPPFTYSGVDFFFFFFFFFVTILYQGGPKGIEKIWCSFYLYVVPSDPFGNSCLI